MEVLITGAAGFTGKYLIDALFNAGHQVHGLESGQRTMPVDKRIRWHEADLLDAAALFKAVHEISPDVVMHLAT
jgi:GDP-6-deoxy-D-talose 4-dehydrogenase